MFQSSIGVTSRRYREELFAALQYSVYEPAKYRIVFYVEDSKGLELRDERAPPSTPPLARQKGEMATFHFLNNCLDTCPDNPQHNNG